MGKHYSASTGGFYDDAVHTGMPDDAVAVTDEDHAALLAGQAGGKRITADANGRPVLSDVPADPAEARRAAILAELARLDLVAVRPLRAKATGTATAADDSYLADLESQALVLRQELEDLNTQPVEA